MSGAGLPPLDELLTDHDLLLAALETPGFWNRELRDLFGGSTVESVVLRPVGTGQVASVTRVDFGFDAPGAGNRPGSVVVKTASADPVNRMTSAALRHAEVEVGFYRAMAAACGARTPRCHLARINDAGDDFLLVLEDLAGFTQADQISGMSLDEVGWAIDEMAALHATWWDGVPPATESFLAPRGDPAAHATLLSMLHDGFVQRYGEVLGTDVLEAARRLVDSAAAYLAHRPGPTAVTHGDFRPDNLLVRDPGMVQPAVDRTDPAARPEQEAMQVAHPREERDGSPVAVVDWQTVTIGQPLADLSYFIGGALLPDLRTAHEPELLERYRARLAEGGVTLSRPEVEAGYRRYALDGLVMAIGASQVVGRTDRGDEMFCAMAERSALHALEAGAFEVLE